MLEQILGGTPHDIMIGICLLILTSLGHLILRIVQFVSWVVKKKAEATVKEITDNTSAIQTCTKAIEKLEQRMEKNEVALAEVPKLKTDLRRWYAALRVLAKDDWPKIREEIIKDDLTVGG